MGETGHVPFPSRLLADGERVVLDLRPHWRALVPPVLVLLLVAVGVGFGFTVARDHPLVRLILAVTALVLLLAFSLAPFLRWRATHYVVTDRRVLVRTGVLRRSGRDVPLSRVNDITFTHSLVERALGCGTLAIESAGTGGQVVLRSIPAVEQVHRTLYDLLEQTDRRLRGPE